MYRGCSGNTKSWLEAVMEHLVGRQDQPRGAQVHAMPLIDWKGWSQDPPLPRPHLRVGSEGKGFLLEVPAYLRPSEGEWIFSLISVPSAAAYEHLLLYSSLGPCCSAVTAVLSSVLHQFCSEICSEKLLGELLLRGSPHSWVSGGGGHSVGCPQAAQWWCGCLRVGSE